MGDYHMGVGEKGRTRRGVLNQINNRSTAEFLLTSGLKPGMRVLDLGCGMGIMTSWIAEQVGAEGSVVGIDSSEEQLTIAREIAKEEGLNNVEFVQLAAEELSTLDQEFDFVYCRYLLIHLKSPELVFDQVYQLLAKDGVFACQSAIYGRGFSYPENEAFDRFREMRCDVLKKLGKDPRTGEQAYHMMYGAGFRAVQARLFQPVLNTPYQRKEMLLGDLSEQEDAFVQHQLIDDAGLEQLKEDLQELVYDESAFIAFYPSTQVSGIKQD
jgi:ubiquinone/menaquinone biosynthesis C-methylase UbiE